MRILLAVPTMNPRLLDKCLFNAWAHSKTGPGTLIWFNGMDYRAAHQAALDMGHMRNQINLPVILKTDFSTENIGVTPALDRLYRMAKTFNLEPTDFILFIHDDCLILEDGWDQKCLDWLAERPNCAAFGYGGARGLGHPDLYKIPYELSQLARRGFVSNMINAEDHGQRATSPVQVATLDLFSLAVRYDLLQKLDGWKWWPTVHHSLDNAMCCQVRRAGLETWMFPVSCAHNGGMTSTKVNFQADFGEEETKIHQDSHTVLYEMFRDVLPFSV